MPQDPVRPLTTVRLELHRPEEPANTPVAANLSVAELVGRTLFVASDEGARIERLVTRDGTVYGEHTSFALADAFDLPGGPEGEADIEGVSADSGWLWVVGSHSLARRKPKPGLESDAESLDKLTAVRLDPNRYLLGRIPLVETEGVLELAAGDGRRQAGCLRMGRRHNALYQALRNDEHIGRFLEVPAKENGFDVEGLAARGDRVFLGLRGPVLRGWACILELHVETRGKGRRLRLGKLGPDGARYRKHFLDLDGLGIRELAFDGDDLLILAGPTMDLDGPVAVHRWRGVLEAFEGQIVPRGDLSLELRLPYGDGRDHAEGITRLDRPGASPLLLVVYDSPDKETRLLDNGRTVIADLFELPRR
ncbi:MAG TPA: DUF3616 domain-containing protein [Azospirillum sp.]|nr:DUF3616 domain-containing protein [Azospirillum sp.]